MNTPVNFELAKLLKEKGLDIPTQRYYEHALTSKKDSETNDYTGSFGWEKGETNLRGGYFKNNYGMADLSNENWYMCSAPTIAEVVMWCFDKYGIWVYADYYNENRWFGVFRTKEGVKKELFDAFNTPTEAYEAAIEYTLNNLI